MERGWPPVVLSALLGVAGCAGAEPRAAVSGRAVERTDTAAVPAAYHPPTPTPTPANPPAPATAAAIDGPDAAGGPQPVEVYIRKALAENRTVRAARWNVLALRHRIPQVTALDDPVVSNTVFPIPSVAPQYSLMGYMPYDGLIAQQFPWFGTLRLRGRVAGHDVSVALSELAAAQLDVVADVKRAYYDLYVSERSEAILDENRGLAEDFLRLARERYRTATATQVDVLRAESAVADIDRERAAVRQGLAEARAELARLMHVSPETELHTLPTLPSSGVPAEVERLYRLAVASRPELQGRLAAVARDETAVELARKRYYPNFTLGAVYQGMTEANATVGRQASGMPNVGLFVGFNVPIYRRKLAAGVAEAQARAAANAELYHAELDQAHRDVKDFFTQARVQQTSLDLLRRVNLPNSRRILEATAGDYRAGNLDYLGLISAWRDVLQVELQVAQLEAELGKALASLERAVGVQLNEHPPRPAPAPAAAPAPARGPGPFHRPEADGDGLTPPASAAPGTGSSRPEDARVPAPATGSGG